MIGVVLVGIGIVVASGLDRNSSLWPEHQRPIAFEASSRWLGMIRGEQSLDSSNFKAKLSAPRYKTSL